MSQATTPQTAPGSCSCGRSLAPTRTLATSAAPCSLFVVHPDSSGLRAIPLETGGGFSYAFSPGVVSGPEQHCVLPVSRLVRSDRHLHGQRRWLQRGPGDRHTGLRGLRRLGRSSVASCEVEAPALLKTRVEASLPVGVPYAGRPGDDQRSSTAPRSSVFGASPTVRLSAIDARRWRLHTRFMAARRGSPWANRGAPPCPSAPTRVRRPPA